MNFKQSVGIQNPFQNQEIQINNMDPTQKSPEEQERLNVLRQEFDSKYRNLLEKGLGEEGKNLIGKIAGQYEIQDGNIKKAVKISVESLEINEKEKEGLNNYILQVLTTKETINKLREGKIKVKSGDILSELNAETLPGNHIDFNEEGNDIKPGEKISTIGRNVYKENDGKKTEVGEVLVGFGTQSIEFPILERLFDSGEISEEEFKDITANLDKGNELEESIGELQNPEIKEKIIDLVEKIDNDPEKNKKDFLEDFSGKAIQKGEEINFKEDNIMSIIGENYVKMPDDKGEYNLDKDFSTAVRTAASKIIKKTPSLDKNSESFKDAMRQINSGNHEKEYLGLSFLFNKSSSDKGKGKKTKEQNERFKRQDELNDLNLQERFDKIQKLLRQAKNNNDKRLQKQAEIAEKNLKQEAQENGSNGDIPQLGGGKYDILAQIDSLLENKQA